ncbi:MAG: ATP-binding protein [Candidatus Thermoplasmatota archaeon]|nr:ATP-binding protein [Candidatus Thermoplasmatota archaeon]
MDERHRRLLIKQNPHWSGDPIRTYEFKRDQFHILQKDMDHPQIIAIVGLRRTGKTVLLKQIMQDLQWNVPDNNIGYISFDDRDFQRYETANELIDYFLTFSNRDERRYLFLDEIQKVPNWPDLLKTLYDIEEGLKIIISGSSSLDLKDSRETLAGRILTHIIPVLSFREFVGYFGHLNSIEVGSLSREYDLKFLSKKEIYISLLEDYIRKGAFPELLDQSDQSFITRYIKESVIDKVISDISRKIRPRREDIVNDLLIIFSRNTARLFEIVNIANALGIDRNTASEYINTLKSTFLIKVDHNFTKSALKRARTSKKAYIAHSCIPIAMLEHQMGSIDGTDMGHLIETIIANNLTETAFWRSPGKEEVDIVLSGPIPVEIKYRDHIGKKDLAGLLRFMDRFDVRTGMVVTRDELDLNGSDDRRILRIPVWLFLLIDQKDLLDLK